jgi:S-phase kinase-associated protein 1
MEETKSEYIVLLSNEGVEFSIESKKILHKIELITVMMEDISDIDDIDDINNTTQNIIPLPNINSKVLQKVLQFYEHEYTDPMQNIMKPIKNADMKINVQEWYAQYIDINVNDIIELIKGAHYLNASKLIDLCAAKIATLIKDKTPDEIRNIFNIENELTPDEMEKINNDNKWLDEESKSN